MDWEEPRVQEFGRGGRITGGPQPEFAQGPRRGRPLLAVGVTALCVAILIAAVVIALIR